MRPCEVGSKRALRALAQGMCAACGEKLVAGPRGGAAQNFYCRDRDKCRLGFNLTFAGPYLVYAQRLGEVDDERFAMYSKARGRR